MNGPAFAQIDSHHAIHEAAHLEAVELTAMYEKALKANHAELALQTAYLIVEHWETRTLAHAQAEETGFYKNTVELHPEIEAVVIALTRDHELMRNTVQEIKALLTTSGALEDVLYRFQCLLLLERNHSRDEERRLVLQLHPSEIRDRAERASG